MRHVRGGAPPQCRAGRGARRPPDDAVEARQCSEGCRAVSLDVATPAGTGLADTVPVMDCPSTRLDQLHALGWALSRFSERQQPVLRLRESPPQGAGARTLVPAPPVSSYSREVALARSSSAHVVLVPGIGLDARAWAAVRARLTAPSDVVPLPSLGQAAPRGSDLSVERQSRRLIAALPPTGDLVLVGHSAGCPVVVAAAAREPRVVGLVLVGPVTDPRGRSWPRILGQWARTTSHEHLWEIPLLAPQYRSTGLGSMLRGMNQIRRYRTGVALAALAMPTDIVRGEHDHIASAHWCAGLASSAPTQWITVPGAAHMVNLTHPSVIAASADRLAFGTGRGTERTVLRGG